MRFGAYMGPLQIEALFAIPDTAQASFLDGNLGFVTCGFDFADSALTASYDASKRLQSGAVDSCAAGAQTSFILD
jgi:hypothetical protein